MQNGFDRQKPKPQKMEEVLLDICLWEGNLYPPPKHHQAKSLSAGERIGNLGIVDSEMSNNGTGDLGVRLGGVVRLRAAAIIFKI